MRLQRHPVEDPRDHVVPVVLGTCRGTSASTTTGSFGGDDNFKTFAYSEGSGPYNMPNNWYAEYNPQPTNRTSDTAYHLNDDATGTATQSLQTPDQNGHRWWWNDAVNPMSGVWTKVEMELK